MRHSLSKGNGSVCKGFFGLDGNKNTELTVKILWRTGLVEKRGVMSKLNHMLKCVLTIIKTKKLSNFLVFTKYTNFLYFMY